MLVQLMTIAVSTSRQISCIIVVNTSIILSTFGTICTNLGCHLDGARVQMTSSRVIDKMVVDEGRALQPCRYRLFTHMSCIILYPYST